MDIDLTLNADPKILRALRRLERKVDAMIQLLTTVSTRTGDIVTDLSALQSAVEENTSVDESAIQLLEGLADKIEELSTDPEALAAFVGDLRSSSAGLAASVAANTGALGTPAPEPEPEAPVEPA